MPRLLQVNSLLHKNISQIMAERIEVPQNSLITVTRVACGADLKEARVFVSILPFAKAEEGLAFLFRKRNEIQKLLGQTLKMKFTPKILFFLDDTEETASQIYSELDKL